MPKKRERSLEEEYRHELHKRSGWGADQLPTAAASGDREAIAACAGVAATLFERAPIKPEFHPLREWLVDALFRVHAGESPDAAFGWVQPRKQHRRREFRTIQRQWLVGQHMSGLLAGRPELKPEEAAELVGNRLGVSADTALDYWKAFRTAEGKNG